MYVYVYMYVCMCVYVVCIYVWPLILKMLCKYVHCKSGPPHHSSLSLSLSLSLDYRWDSWLSGLSATCLRRLWVHFQALSFHTAWEVHGGPCTLGSSRESKFTHISRQNWGIFYCHVHSFFVAIGGVTNWIWSPMATEPWGWGILWSKGQSTTRGL